jgi:acetoacetyl-CoA synthetase
VGEVGGVPEFLWQPTPMGIEHSELGRYLRWLAQHRGLKFDSYEALWRWSTGDLEGFWGSLWEYFGVRHDAPYIKVLSDRVMPGARWFEGSTLNFADHVLQHHGSETAIRARSQTREGFDLSFDELRDQVGRARAGLERLGVGSGDRVVAYLPNIPEAIVAYLATVSLGAIWSSCSPEFGARSVTDRFSQVRPKLLLAIDGYRYGTKDFDRSAEVGAIISKLPTLERVVHVPYLRPESSRLGALAWDDLLVEAGEPRSMPVPFDHPLHILYSSGTTGLPKPIVHGHGGIVIEHLKTMSFAQDLGPGSVYFQVSSTAWMMWNFLLSALLVRSTIVCFDGDPNEPDPMSLWRMIADLGVTHFGTSATYLSSCRKIGLRPGRDTNLSALRLVLSTGSPLPADSYRWVYGSVRADVMLFSGSGGTDVCSAFVGGCPMLPVVAGEISGPALGVDVRAFDSGGRSVVGEQGELVIAAPMPSMPLGFWGDRDGAKLKAAYFDMYPGVWRHGDWLTVTERGTYLISGRSDSTLNRAGVRLGTAEFYDVVESMEEIDDSLVVHLEDSGGGPGLLLLLIHLAEGYSLDDRLEGSVRSRLRSELSPRHIPDEIRAIPGVPRTLTGKKLEVPVKRILLGADPDTVASRGSVVNASALDAVARMRPSLAR